MESKSRKIFHSRPLFYGFLALLLAISTSRYLFDANLKYIFFVLIIFSCFIGYCIWIKKWVPVVAILCIFFFGLGWFFVGEKTFEGKIYEGQNQVIGRISDDVSYSSYGNSAEVVLKDVYINGNKEKNIALTIYIDSYDDFQVGDIIAFDAEVEKVSLFTLKNFNSFYYRDKTPYTSTVDADDFVVQGNSVNADEKFRLAMKDLLYQNMGQTNGAVAYAVLFGDKTEVDDDIYQSYKTAGIIHLLTVSGLHVGFLIALLGFILKKCKVRGIYNFIICAICIGLYAYICGFAPSILRAGIMGLVLLSAKLSGKCYDNLNTLGLAGIIILLFSPLSALDVGFLMSFFCVLGIFVITPWLSKLCKKVFPKVVAESFAVSIGAEIGILPFLAVIYSNLNILTFFINLIVIPIFAVLYPFLFVSLFICAVLPFMGFLLKICGWGFEIIYRIADFFGETSLIFDLEPFDIFLVAGVFVLLFFISKYFMASRKTKTICCSAILVFCGILSALYLIPVNVQSSVVYGYNYSLATVILTNEQGNSIIVDPGYSTYTKNLIKNANIKNLSAAFVLQKSSAYIDTIRGIGIDTIIRSDTGQGYDEEVVVNFDEVGSVGGFSFQYKSFDDRLIGLEILFDNTKLFILRDLKQSDDALTFISNENYDIVILGKHDEYAEYFTQSQILTYYQNSLSQSSFVENGNIGLLVNDKNYVWRCLD